MDGRFKVVCGACKREPGLTPDGDGEVAICFGCGLRDSVDEAFRIAGEHHALRIAGIEHKPLTAQGSRWEAVSV